MYKHIDIYRQNSKRERERHVHTYRHTERHRERDRRINIQIYTDRLVFIAVAAARGWVDHCRVAL